METLLSSKSNTLNAMRILRCLHKKPKGKFKDIVRAAQDKTFAETVWGLHARILDDYCNFNGWDNNPPATDRNTVPLSYVDLISYLFSETYADLQAIIMLNVTFEEYDVLFKSNHDKSVPFRKLAVTAALIKTNWWSRPQDKSCSPVIDLNPKWSAGTISKYDINPTLYYDLVQYLCCCAKKIEQSCKMTRKKDELMELRSVFDILRGSDLLSLESNLRNFTDHFRNTMHIRWQPTK